MFLNPTLRSVFLVLALLLAPGTRPLAPAPPAPDLSGEWAGALMHDGESQPIALRFAPSADGRYEVALSLPATHLDHVVLGRVPLSLEGDSPRLGPFRMAYDRKGGTLRTTCPRRWCPCMRSPSCCGA